jgi:ABC-type branched-subunit amino acid transport system substrate-binding protein
MPLVGPYTALPPDGSGDQTNRFTFYPISGLAQQVKVLLEAMARDHGTQGMRIGIVYPQLPDINTLAGEARTHAEKLGFGHVVDSGYAYDAFDAENLVSRMRVGVDAVLFLGSAAALQEFALEAWRADWLPYLLSPGLLAEAGVFDLPRNFSGRVLLAYASLPTDFSTQGRAEFEELHEKFGFDYSFSIAQIAAYTAAKVMVEGLHLAGRNLSREQLLESLEGLDGYHPGLAPAVSFGPGRRIGALGGHVVRPDLVNGRFEESTQWIDLGDGAVGE